MKKKGKYYYKGSKRMMQILVDKYPDIVDRVLGVKLKWLSPIKKDNFAEYQLNGKFMCESLGLQESMFDGFWLTRQAQWHGLALSDNNDLYLFEAKSHLSEISCGNYLAKEENNKQKIDNYKQKEASILNVAHNTYGIKDKDNVWLHKYYQVSNRLTFLEKMKELSGSYNNVHLVFINFENDPTWTKEGKDVTADEWNAKYIKIFHEMGDIADKCKQLNVHVINIDAKNF